MTSDATALRGIFVLLHSCSFLSNVNAMNNNEQNEDVAFPLYCYVYNAYSHPGTRVHQVTITRTKPLPSLSLLPDYIPFILPTVQRGRVRVLQTLQHFLTCLHLNLSQ